MGFWIISVKANNSKILNAVVLSLASQNKYVKIISTFEELLSPYNYLVQCLMTQTFYGQVDVFSTNYDEVKPI